MRSHLHAWLHNISFSDPMEQKQAMLVQMLLIAFCSATVLSMPILFLGTASTRELVITLASSLLVLLSNIVALVVLRYGYFQGAVIIATSGIVISTSISLIQLGMIGGGYVLMAFPIPIALAGLLAGRRALSLVSGLTILIIIAIGIYNGLYPRPLDMIAVQDQAIIKITAIAIMIVLAFSLLLDRLGTSLREVITTSLEREQELARLSALLETKVAERTASLETALHTVEQREVRLSQTLDELRTSQAIVRKLSAPVIPVLEGVLVAPLMGTMDQARMQMVTDNLLAEVQRTAVEYVIFDVTGLPALDIHVAETLSQTAAAVRLLGGQTILVGIRPEVAQIMVTLHIGLDTMKTFADLHQAIKALLARQAIQHSYSVVGGGLHALP